VAAGSPSAEVAGCEAARLLLKSGKWDQVRVPAGHCKKAPPAKTMSQSKSLVAPPTSHSHASPTPFPLASSWEGLERAGQLSQAVPTVS